MLLDILRQIKSQTPALIDIHIDYIWDVFRVYATSGNLIQATNRLESIQVHEYQEIEDHEPYSYWN